MRGRALLMCRLVASSLRRRPAEVVLTVVAIAATTTTLMLGLALRDVTAHPYQTTRAITSGPDVAAMPDERFAHRALHGSMPWSTTPVWSATPGRSP